MADTAPVSPTSRRVLIVSGLLVALSAGGLAAYFASDSRAKEQSKAPKGTAAVAAAGGGGSGGAAGGAGDGGARRAGVASGSLARDRQRRGLGHRSGQGARRRPDRVGE